MGKHFFQPSGLATRSKEKGISRAGPPAASSCSNNGVVYIGSVQKIWWSKERPTVS